MNQIKAISLFVLSLFYLMSTALNFSPICNSEAEHLEYIKSVHQFFHHGTDLHEECQNKEGLGEEKLQSNSPIFVLLHKIYDKENPIEDKDCVATGVTDIFYNNEQSNDIILPFSTAITSAFILFENEYIPTFFSTIEKKFPTPLLNAISLRGPPSFLV